MTDLFTRTQHPVLNVVSLYRFHSIVLYLSMFETLLVYICMDAVFFSFKFNSHSIFIFSNWLDLIIFLYLYKLWDVLEGIR